MLLLVKSRTFLENKLHNRLSLAYCIIYFERKIDDTKKIVQCAVGLYIHYFCQAFGAMLFSSSE